MIRETKSKLCTVFLLLLAIKSETVHCLEDADIISLESFPHEQRKQLEEKILNFLGLERPPQPNMDTIREADPASKFMLSLYRAMLRPNVQNDSDDIFLKRLSLADTIMSFIDHGQYFTFRFCIMISWFYSFFFIICNYDVKRFLRIQ